MGERSTNRLMARAGYCEDVLSRLPDAVLILDASGTITYANRAAERVLGESRFLIGRRYDSPSIFTEQGRSLQRADFEGHPIEPAPPHPVDEVLASGEPYENALFRLTTSGHARRYMAAAAVPLASELGGVGGVALVYRDVTEDQAHRFETEWLRRELAASKRQVEELLGLSDALNAINGTVHSTLDTRVVLRQVVRQAAQALRVESATIDLRQDDGWTMHVSFGLPKVLLGRHLTDAQAPHAAIVAETRQPLVVEDAAADYRFDPEMLRAMRIRSMLTVPLTLRGETVGVISFHRPFVGGFGYEQVSFATKVAATTSLAMENARVYEEERHIADTLQRALLVIPAQVPGVRFEHLYQSATEAAWVGGDFFDLFEMPGDRVGVLIGDVSGKGIEASTLASFTRQLLRAHAVQDLSPAEVVSRTNELVFRASRTEDFVTLFFGIVSLHDHTMTFCNAGHPPPIVCREGFAEPLLDGGPLIGAWGDLEWTNHATSFGQGDLLLLYTDGVIEAKRDGELFGETRLTALIQALRSRPFEDIPKRVLAEVTAFTDGRLRDDIAMLAVSPT